MWLTITREVDSEGRRCRENTGPLTLLKVKGELQVRGPQRKMQLECRECREEPENWALSLLKITAFLRNKIFICKIFIFIHILY